MGTFQLFSLLLIFLLNNQTWAHRGQRGICSRENYENALKERKNNVTQPPKFQLYNSGRDEDFCQIVTLQSKTLESCSFNASLPLVMIIHGWSVDGIMESWIGKMAAAFKSREEPINVIVVDWLSSALDHYPKAVRKTRIIGIEIAEFVEWLEASIHYPKSKVHLIGYSLGAHISGFAGSFIKNEKKIGRITGLDPAGPMFEGTSSTERLSPDDAEFVDVIHTYTQEQMGVSIGIDEPVGHYDFYPNGGIYQPGCEIHNLHIHIAEYGFNAIPQTIKCSHERSVHLFIDSLLNEDKQSMGYHCKDFSTFEKGMCLSCRKGRCNTLGYNIKKKALLRRRRLFFLTLKKMPYKVYHYQFKILFISQFSQEDLNPTFTVSLTGAMQDVANIPLTPINGMKGNKTYTFLVTLDTDIGDLLEVKFRWEGVNLWTNIMNSVQTLIPWSSTDIPGLLIKTIKVKSGDTQKKMTFCSQDVDNVKVISGKEKTFVKCTNIPEIHN
ncbi:hepatic triacylglycerol lipase [Discoglossus pictus]